MTTDDHELLDYIDRYRLHTKVDEVIRDEMLEVFDEYFSASEFATEAVFSEQFLWNPKRWTNSVRLKIMEIIDAHDGGYAQTVSNK